MKKLFIVCLFLSATFQISAQLDTVFWFVAPEVAQQHGDRPIVFRFATLANPATITISQPANPLFPTQVLNLAANSAQTLDLTLWIDIVENKPANTVLNYGFKISATANITAYYEVNPTCACNPDIFSLKGKNSVGTSFLTPFQNFLNNASYARSAFNIVATQDNTTITIVPTQNIVGHAANVPFTIVLNKGQTYSAENVSTAAGQHLGGSAIVSDKPIAVTLSDDTAQGTPYGGCADLMGDQLIPTSIIGSEYIAIKGYLNGPDKLYIVAATNGTQITIDGAVVGTINATQTYVHTLSTPTAYIQTSEPAYVLHQSGFGCEVGEAILPPIVCTGSNVVPFVRSTNEFFALNILVPAGGENSFVLNGNPALINPASFNFVPGTGNAWMYAQVDASAFVTALQNSRLENTVEKFHLGLIHGGASSGCRFGYFSDFASYRYEIQMNGQSYCTGDDINFTTTQLPGATYQWTGPNGYSAAGLTVTIPDAQLVNAGQYIISGNLPDACELLPDTVLITIVELPQAPQVFTNGPVCAQDSLLFWNQVAAPLAFSWFDAAGNALPANDTIVFYPATAGSMTLSLTSTIGGCVSPPTSATIDVFSLPTVTYTGPLDVCGNQVNFSATAVPDPQDPVAQYAWTMSPSNLPLGTGQSLANVTASGTPSVSNDFVVTATSALGCMDQDTFTVNFHAIPSVDFTWIDLCDGASIDFTNSSSWTGIPNASDLQNYSMTFGDGTTGTDPNVTHVYPAPGSYMASLVSETDFGCTDFMATPVLVGTIPETNITIDDGCGLIQLNADIVLGNVALDSLLWVVPGQFSNNQQNAEFFLNTAGNYAGTLTLYTSNDCIFTEAFDLIVIPSIGYDDLIIPNVITANNDGINDEIQIDPLFGVCNEYTMDIVNRWGNSVFTLSNGSAAFKGDDAGGKALLPGVYFYVFKCEEGMKQGNITIVR